MPRPLAVSAALLAGLVLAHAAPTNSPLQERLEEKLAKPFLENADWVLTYDGALKLAREEGKLVFAYFARSYEP